MIIPTQYCPVCKSNNWNQDQLAGQMLGLPTFYSILHCKTCGQRRIDPQLTDDELKALYSDGYFNSAKAEYSDGYFNSAKAEQSPEKSIKMASDYITEVVPSLHAQFERTIQRLKKLHPDAVTFLDVGAATGDMVKIALDYGLAAEGIEFSDFAVKKAKELYSIELLQISIGELDKTDYFDLIHLNHVFEHFNDPMAELGHLHRLLKPGGALYIEIPYQFHPLEKLLFRLKGKCSEFTVESLHHPYFYSPKTIRKLLQDNDFEIIKFSVFDSERYPSDTYMKKIKMTLWWLLSVVSIGNYISVFARRKP